MTNPTYPPPAIDPMQTLEPSRSARGLVARLARIITYLVYFYILTVELVLLTGFTLLLFGANPDSPFVGWAYRNLDRTMEPFRGIFAPIELGVTGNDVLAVFDTSVVFAMVMYSILALALNAVIDWLTNQIFRIERADYFARLRAQSEEAILETSAGPSEI